MNTKPQYKKVVCADGFTVSIQASKFHYCEPRNDAGPYTEVELGYPNMVPTKEIIRHAEDPDDLCHTIYGYVLADAVERLIRTHGGMVSGELPPLDIRAAFMMDGPSDAAEDTQCCDVCCGPAADDSNLCIEHLYGGEPRHRAPATNYKFRVPQASHPKGELCYGIFTEDDPENPGYLHIFTIDPGYARGIAGWPGACQIMGPLVLKQEEGAR